VTEKDQRRDDEAALQQALFRYGVIAELVERPRESFERGEVTTLVAELAARPWYRPFVGPVHVSERTVYSWLRAYRHDGLDGLCPRVRSDCGALRVLTADIVERAAQLRMENRRRSTRILVDILRREGVLAEGQHFHRSTLDRHLDERGASRRQLKVLGSQRTIKMQFERFGDLWVGDYHHGPVILGPDGRPTAAKLGAFIDHFTRWPVAHRYYLAENIGSLRECLLRALLIFGPPKKAYTDRGAVYRAEQLAYSLSRLGSHLIHSRPYYSKGRAVIERWWQLAGAFESEVEVRSELLTLHELNRLWEAYCELNYCQQVHSELGRTPAEAIAEVTPQPIDPDVARELFRVRVERTVHKEDGCVSVYRRRYLCEPWLRGRKVHVRYDPNDRDFVVIFFKGRRVQRAYPQPLNARPEPPIEPEQVTQSVDYLALVRQDYDRQLLEHARPLAYARIQIEPGFGREAFIEAVRTLARIEMTRSNRQELGAFWDAFGPLPETLIRIGTEHAVRLHGPGRHCRVYLHAIRTLVLAHWQRPSNTPTDTEDSP
jgi:putative transposase